MDGPNAESKPRFDVVIAGGGLAGLTLALQIRRQQPERSVLVVDKLRRPLPESSHKIGESTVELGAQYLEKLGLRDYLHERHLIKFGLRFFPGGGKRPLEERSEIGPSDEPVVCSYQLDRGIFENDLRQMIVDAGAQLWEGAKVKELSLGKASQVEDPDRSHTVHIEQDTGAAAVDCRWFIDATGRAAHLRKRFKLKRGSGHSASAGWFRIRGKFDIQDLVPPTATKWHRQRLREESWRSTNHFMGPGYWAWVIPLSSGNTSIGLVLHEDQHGFEHVQNQEGMMAFLHEHEPVLARALQNYETLDFGCIRHYCHQIGRSFSSDRWTLVGDAGAFADPLYSPGTDAIAYSNAFTEELIRVDFAGGDLRRRAQELSIQYRSLISGTIDLYRNASPIYNHARAMREKIFWDNFAYWSYPCQYMLREIYRLTGPEHAAFTALGQRFVELTKHVQDMMHQWAVLAPEPPEAGFWSVPSFPSILIDTHIAVAKDMTPDETLDYMRNRLDQGEELIGEILLRLVIELGAGKAKTMIDQLGIYAWKIRLPRKRIELEPTVGLARRRALPFLVRDIERTIGRPNPNTTVPEALELLAPLLQETPGPTPRLSPAQPVS